jgi:Mce-associated membrane protein
MTPERPAVEADDLLGADGDDARSDIRTPSAEADIETPSAEADIRTQLAEAEAAEAEARAVAAQARAKAAGLQDTEAVARPAARPRHTAGVVLAALLTGASVALTGLMLWQHREVAAQRSQDLQFVDAARAGVTALLSIDHTRAEADVQRVLDLSTGAFREDFERSADDFIKTAVDSKAVTSGTVNAAALDTLDGDSGVVMVAATSEVTNTNGADQDPRPFRISVTVTRDGGTPKMSDVEFVP